MMSGMAGQPFLDFLRERLERGCFEAADLETLFFPLLRQVQAAHAEGLTAPLEGVADLRVSLGQIWFPHETASHPRDSGATLRGLERPESDVIEIVGRQRLAAEETDAGPTQLAAEDLLLGRRGQPITRPVYLPGYVSWEHEIEHHDALTDIFVLGLVFASLACGLDLTEPDQMTLFVESRRNLFALSPRLHPVFARAIVQMTELDRHRRPQDLPSLIHFLEHYRDQEVDLPLTADLAGAEPAGRRDLILTRLRDRLFEFSRRNRLIYFRSTLSTLDLTVASVPMLLDLTHIRMGQLVFWHEELARELIAGKTLHLNKRLRFEDTPYIKGVLDKIRLEDQRHRNEYGFSQLRLVLCFLRWTNLKEAPEERINSPLILLPVELVRKKGVRDAYHLNVLSTEAEVNPALRQYLRQLYNLDLPETVDLTETTLDTFYEELRARIQASEPGINFRKIERPPIELVHQQARRRLAQHRRGLRLSGRAVRSYGEIDYSYHPDNYQPLGLQLFLRHVRPSPSAFEGSFGAPHPRRSTPPSAFAVLDTPEPTIERQTWTMHAREDERNPYLWDFDLCALTLGQFNYRKMSLVRDYTTLLQEAATGQPFEELFPSRPREADSREAPSLALEEQFHVVPSDPTQTAAIARARQGGSLIIQGPPGTGKSQTITNLIVDAVMRGRRVLFICEKRAAIDVVYHRLDRQGLGELACLIHDTQDDRRGFIQDLKKIYEDVLQDQVNIEAIERERAALLARMRKELDGVVGFAEAMQRTGGMAGLPLLGLYERLIALRKDLPELDPRQTELVPEYRHWLEHGAAVRRLAETLRELDEEPVFARHPLRFLNEEVLSHPRPIDHLATCLEQAKAHLHELNERLAQSNLQGDAWGLWSQLESLAVYLDGAEPLARLSLLALGDPGSPQSAIHERMMAEYRAKLNSREAARMKTRPWRAKLPEADLPAALTLARACEKSIFSFLRPAFWRLRALLSRAYDFSAHALRPAWSQVLADLETEYQLNREIERIQEQAREQFGINELSDFDESRQRFLEHCRSLNPSLQAVHELLLSPQGTRQFHAALNAIARSFRQLQQALSPIVSGIEAVTLVELADLLGALEERLDRLPELLAALEGWPPLPGPLKTALRRLPLTPDGHEAAMARATLEQLYRADRALARFDGDKLRRHMDKLAGLHGELLAVNARLARTRLRHNFQENMRRAAQPAAALTPEERAFKHLYSSGRRELEHELAKTMRHKTIRQLAAGPAGRLIRDLKPVWLMSPLSVSDALPLVTDGFDVVIFDEASQIPLEEAIPAIFRAPQMIVVGDEMQLPPTNFFSARAPAEDDPLQIEEDGETYEYDLQAESFLTQCAGALPSTMLGWHYRSRHESLISFSNASFYGGRLLTVPDQRLWAAGGEIRATCAADGARNAADIFRRSISYHFLAHGIYEKRRNPAEAEYIAELLRAMLTEQNGPSIGIVAFSEAQQDEIEDALERLGRDDPAFHDRLEEEMQHEEDGEFAGLFIKNLENVQGDERDVIILSICYGPDARGRMLMNFGPINKNGGERRLNVVFSRARHHMVVVSSIKYSQITNEYNDGASCLRRYLQYAEAVSGGDWAAARRLVRADGTGNRSADDGGHSRVVKELGERLRAAGWHVEEDVGHSHFRCDLAVRGDCEEAHRLGILVDTPGYYRTRDPLERCVQRPGVLAAFGWEIEFILTKDWHHDPEGVMRRMARRLNGVNGDKNQSCY